MKKHYFLAALTVSSALLNFYLIFIKPQSEIITNSKTIWENRSEKQIIQVYPENKEKRKNEQLEDSQTSLTKDTDLHSAAFNALRQNATPTCITVGGYKSILYSNSDVSVDLRKKLMGHGVTDEVAKITANKVAKIVKDKFFKRASVFITASGAAYVVVQNSTEKLSLLEKLSIAVSVGLFILLLYFIAIKKRILNI